MKLFKNTLCKQDLVDFLKISLIVEIVIFSVVYFGKLTIQGFFSEAFVNSSQSELYLRIANDPYNFKMADPVRYRILIPLFVHLLPVENKIIGFMIVNLVFLYLTSVLFYYYLKKLYFNPNQSMIGMSLFLLSPVIIYHIANIILIDIPLYFFLLLSFYSILTDQRKLLAISLLFGILIKNVIVLVIVFYIIFNIKKRVPLNVLFRQKLIVVLPAIFAYLILYKLLGPSSNGLFTTKNIIFVYNYFLSLSDYYSLPLPIALGYRIFFPFHILWILAIKRFKKTNNFFESGKLWMFSVFLLLFLAMDIERMLFYLFPIILPLALSELVSEIRTKNDKILYNLLLSLSIIIILIKLSFNHWSNESVFLIFDFMIISILLIKIVSPYYFKKYTQLRNP